MIISAWYLIVDQWSTKIILLHAKNFLCLLFLFPFSPYNLIHSLLLQATLENLLWMGWDRIEFMGFPCNLTWKSLGDLKAKNIAVVLNIAEKKAFSKFFLTCLFYLYLKQLGNFDSHPFPFYSLTAFHKGKFPFFCFLILGGFFTSISFLVFFWLIGSLQMRARLD